jgi:hypothetical protein
LSENIRNELDKRGIVEKVSVQSNEIRKIPIY